MDYRHKRGTYLSITLFWSLNEKTQAIWCWLRIWNIKLWRLTLRSQSLLLEKIVYLKNLSLIWSVNSAGWRFNQRLSKFLNFQILELLNLHIFKFRSVKNINNLDSSALGSVDFKNFRSDFISPNSVLPKNFPRTLDTHSPKLENIFKGILLSNKLIL